MTQPTDKFPPLPEHDVEDWSESGITLRYVGWSEEKVKAYAEAVRTAALNEAIEIVVKSESSAHAEQKLRELRDGK